MAALVRLAPADIPRVDQVALNVNVLVFAVGVAAATALDSVREGSVAVLDHGQASDQFQPS